MKLNIQMFADNWVAIEISANTKNFDAQVQKLEGDLEQLRAKEEALIELNKKFDSTAPKETIKITQEEYKAMTKLGIAMDDIGNKDTFLRLQRQIEQTNNKLVSLTANQETMTNNNAGNTTQALNKIGNSVEGVIKKVARWALAIFSVRSAYMFIRQEMGVLSQYNQTIGADIEYMRWAIANALKPIIEKIIQLAYKLLVYVGYIIKALFGINIFANASASAFERQKKALSGSNAEAKKLEKTLAGFDEMNIIQESGDTSRGGGGGGVALPSQDLKDLMEEVEIPNWLKKLTEWLKKLKDWLWENWYWLKEVGKELALVFGAIQIAKWLGNISKLTTALGAGSGLTGILSGLAKIGMIVVTIAVVYQAYKSYKEFKENFQQLKDDVNNAAQVSDEAQERWNNNLVEMQKSGADADKVTASYAALTRQTKDYTETMKSNTKEIDKMSIAEQILDASLLGAYGTGGQSLKYLEEYKDKVIANIKAIDGMKDAGNLTNEQQEEWAKTLQITIDNLEEAKNSTSATTYDIQMYDEMLKVAKESAKKFGIETGNSSTIVSRYDDWMRKLKDDMKKYADQKIPQKELKIIGTADMSSAENSLSNFKHNALYWLNDLANRMQNIKASSKNAKGAIYIPRLAVGGVINMPGRGVPLGSAIGGERGAEGVIPLTDSQQMSLLGEAIGKYVRIDNVIDVNMDSRKIKRIMASSDNRDRMVGNG